MPDAEYRDFLERHRAPPQPPQPPIFDAKLSSSYVLPVLRNRVNSWTASLSRLLIFDSRLLQLTRAQQRGHYRGMKNVSFRDMISPKNDRLCT